MAVNTLANALNSIKVAEKAGKKEVRVKPSSKILQKILSILQENNYIGEFELIDDGKSGEVLIKLVGKINSCGAISPRFDVKKGDWEKWEQRYLPARNVGFLIVSTSKGIITHFKAKELGLGGKLLVYVY